MRIAPARTFDVVEEPSRGMRLLSPRLLPLGREQETEAVELLAELLLNAAGRGHARAATAERDDKAVAPVDVSAPTPRECGQRVRRAA
jgi:hypothetical protein